MAAAKRYKKPPKDLPDEMPRICINSVYLGGYCEDLGPRQRVLKKMLAEFKAGGRIALAEYQAFVVEKYPIAREEYVAEHGIIRPEADEK